MENQPLALTNDEFKEIAALPEIQELWGGENADVMEQLLRGIYTVKFRFTEYCPGYSGDLFIIQPEVLGREYPVTRLIRNAEKGLKILGE